MDDVEFGAILKQLSALWDYIIPEAEAVIWKRNVGHYESRIVREAIDEVYATQTKNWRKPNIKRVLEITKLKYRAAGCGRKRNESPLAFTIFPKTETGFDATHGTKFFCYTVATYERLGDYKIRELAEKYQQMAEDIYQTKCIYVLADKPTEQNNEPVIKATPEQRQEIIDRLLATNKSNPFLDAMRKTIHAPKKQAVAVAVASEDFSDVENETPVYGLPDIIDLHELPDDEVPF